jgi:hypothetical protein
MPPEAQEKSFHRLIPIHSGIQFNEKMKIFLWIQKKNKKSQEKASYCSIKSSFHFNVEILFGQSFFASLSMLYNAFTYVVERREMPRATIFLLLMKHECVYCSDLKFSY